MRGRPKFVFKLKQKPNGSFGLGIEKEKPPSLPTPRGKKKKKG